MKERKMEARWSFLPVTVLLLLSLGLLEACAAGPARAVSVRGARQETVQMTASDFKFDPAVIKASPGEVLTIAIRNVSGNGHNFTLKDPAGNVLQDVDLPEKSTREVRIELNGPGTYPFFCNKPLHATMGMKGRIEVE